ncbi:MAG: hypothetical protein EBS25_06070, partial [Actinobacteria bacterium]|nr:hypothetical protein [Actinomycetota bacterium]
MSTKTTFKRVALVAVAALGLGLISVAPSSATLVSVQVTPSATTSAIKAGETATISLTVAGIIGAAGDTVTIHGVRTKGTSGTVNFNATTDSTTTRIADSAYATLGSNAYSAGSISIDSVTATAGSAVRAVLQANFVAPSTAGTYEVTIYSSNHGTIETSSKAPFTWTITVTADSKAPDASSTAYIASGAYTKTTDGDSTVTASKDIASTIAATIKVTQKNATSSATEAMQAYVTGPGFVVGANNDSTTSTLARSTTRVISIAAPTVGQSTYVGVYSDGTAGASTITVVGTVTGIVLASKTVTFSDTKPASVAAVVKKAYIAAGKATPKVFAVTVKDSAGNAITGTSVAVTGSRTDTTTAGKAIATAALSCSWNSTDLVYYCTATGASSSVFGVAEYKITATGTDADETAVSTTASTTYSDIVATSVTITAPATANVGDKITYTLTAKEKNGYPVADTTYEGAYADGATSGQWGGILWNTTTVPAYTSSVTPFNAGETITTVSGVATKSLYVPSVAGTIGGTWTLAGSSTSAVGAISKTIGGTTVTTSTVVTNPGVDAATDAANEATDAANAATDAALAAADAADAATMAAQDASDAVAALSASVSKLIASLKAQITSLTNLVIKIQK